MARPPPPLLVLTLLGLLALTGGEIHRAKSSLRSAFPKNSFPERPLHTAAMESWWSRLWNACTSDLTGPSYQPWVWSILASLTIGLSGVLPLAIIPMEAGSSLKTGAAAKTLRLLLSFAVGGLLGDVFLHLLPEAWQRMGPENNKDDHGAHITIGLWVLAGIFTFIIVEMMFEKSDDGLKTENCDSATSESRKQLSKVGNGVNGVSKPKRAKDFNRNEQRLNKRPKNLHSDSNGYGPSGKLHKDSGSMPVQCPQTHNVAGYLNLLANSIDNFTHGLAVAGSFLVSFKVGILTTFAILIHEIPHEIGDFAILLKSGFNRCEAAKAQLATASVGLAGAIAALSAESAQSLGDKTAWILPFTAGGFLNIALVNVLPDILQEKDPRESVKQMLCLVAGIGIMGIVTLFFG